jgi:AbiV family abortive infection protein
MPKGRTEEYRGSLTPESAAAGINLARKNAKRLVSDAQLLLEAGRAPTAAALASLAIEEAGKISIIREILIARSDDELRDGWRRYRDHRAKNGMWIFPELAAQGARRLHEFGLAVDREAEHTALLNSLKQLGLYSDCCGNKGNWADPAAVVEIQLAEDLVKVAVLLASVGNDVTVREMELWAEHMGPSYRMPEMSHALIRWAAAMHAEGLSTVAPDDYAKFLFGEPSPRGSPGLPKTNPNSASAHDLHH